MHDAYVLVGFMLKKRRHISFFSNSHLLFFVSGPWEYQYKNRTKERKVLRKNNSVSRAFRGHNKGCKAVWIKAGIVLVFFLTLNFLWRLCMVVLTGVFFGSLLQCSF